MSLCLKILFGLLLATSVFASDYGFRVDSAELVLDKQNYVLNAKIDYRFSQAAIDALNSGVALTLVLNLDVKRRRAYWLDEGVLSESRVFRIRYQPLAKQFTLVQENSGSMHSYSSFNALLDAMGTIKGLKLTASQNMSKGVYKAGLSVGLNIEALPLPLRPIAYVTPQWYLDSPVYLWSFVN